MCHLEIKPFTPEDQRYCLFVPIGSWPSICHHINWFHPLFILTQLECALKLRPIVCPVNSSVPSIQSSCECGMILELPWCQRASPVSGTTVTDNNSEQERLDSSLSYNLTDSLSLLPFFLSILIFLSILLLFLGILWPVFHSIFVFSISFFFCLFSVFSLCLCLTLLPLAVYFFGPLSFSPPFNPLPPLSLLLSFHLSFHLTPLSFHSTSSPLSIFIPI